MPFTSESAADAGKKSKGNPHRYALREAIAKEMPPKEIVKELLIMFQDDKHKQYAMTKILEYGIGKPQREDTINVGGGVGVDLDKLWKFKNEDK